MALNFPDPAAQTPVNTWSPTSTPSATTNGTTYTWDGEKWRVSGSPAFVNISGDTMTGNLTVPSLNSGPIGGFRNQIINGDFSVKQYFNNGTGSNKYITDRWVTNDSTFGATASVSDVKGASRGLKLEGGSRIIRQLVELPLDNSGDASPGQFYNSSQWTFSIYANVAPEQLTVGFVDTGTGVTNIQSVTGVPAWTATSDVQGAYTRYTCTFTVNTAPVASNRAFRVSWSFASTATFTLAQLERGPVASPYEQRPLSAELALCQRYFEKMGTSGRALVVPCLYCGNSTEPGRSIGIVYFSVPKRAFSTLTVKSVTNTDGKVTRWNADAKSPTDGIEVTPGVLFASTEYGIIQFNDSATNFAAGISELTADAEL